MVNLSHAQCQCVMIESEAWNIQFHANVNARRGIQKAKVKKYVFRFRRKESKEGEVFMPYGRLFKSSRSA